MRNCSIPVRCSRLVIWLLYVPEQASRDARSRKAIFRKQSTPDLEGYAKNVFRVARRNSSEPFFFASRDATPRGTLVPEPKVV